MTREFAASGHAVLVYSTEIPELVGLCDRVCSLYGGADRRRAHRRQSHRKLGDAQCAGARNAEAVQ